MTADPQGKPAAAALPGKAVRQTGIRVLQLVGIVLVFVAVGPPAGAVVFMLTVALIGMGESVDLPGLAWVGLFAVIYAVPLSYLIGAGPAAAAGLIVGIRQAFFGRVRWWYALGAGIAVGLGFLVLTGQPLIRLYDAPDAIREHGAVMVLTYLGATMACWLIVRDWELLGTGAGAATSSSGGAAS